jgi:hypothetical protein
MAVMLVGCSMRSSEPAAVAAVAAAPESAKQAAEASSIGSGAGSNAMPSLERLVIRDAQLTLVHDDPRKVTEHASQLVRAAGGFVLDANMEATGNTVHQAVMQLRVPEPAFESTLKALRGLGKMQRETVTGQDVTEEFVDTQSRVRALRTLEARLIALLERSGPLEELLRVEQELARVRSDIERNEGRVRYLQERTHMSSIRLSVETSQAPEIIERASIAQRFERAFDTGTTAGVSLVQLAIVALGFLLPTATAGGLLAAPFLFLRARKKRQVQLAAS